VHLLAPGRLQYGGIRTVSSNGQATVRSNGRQDMAGVMVTFDDGSVLRLQSSAEFSGRTEVLDNTK